MKIKHLHHRQIGFTLIEIVVVVAIVGVLTAIVTIGLQSNNDRDARLQAQRFMAVVNEVRDEALVSGGHYSMSVDEQERRYVFEPLHETGQTDGGDLLRPRSVTDGVDIEFDVLERTNVTDSTEAQVFISALGDITPFELRFEGTKNDYTVSLNDHGELHITSQGSRI